MIKLFVLIILLMVNIVGAVNNQTINPFPINSSPTSFPQLQVFARDETAAILSKRFRYGFIVSGGIHGTSGSCISPSFSMEAFTNTQERVLATAELSGSGGPAAINYNNVGCNCQNPGSDHAWVIASSQPGNTIGNYRRAINSNFFVNCSDVDQPPTPTDSVALFDTVITNGQITSVTNGSFVQGIIDAVPDGQTAEIPFGTWTAGPNGLKVENRNNFTLTCTDNGTTIKGSALVNQTFSGSFKAFMQVATCTNCMVSNCLFDGDGLGAISLGVRNSTYVKVMNNKFKNNGATGSFVAVGNNYGLYKNNFVSNPDGGQNGIVIGTVDGLTEFNCVADSNVVDGMPAAGIFAVSNGCSLINNIAINNLGSGFDLRFAVDTSVTNNVSSRNGAHGISLTAISTARSARVTLANNQIRQNGSIGIAIVSALDVNVVGNITVDNFDYGVYVDDASRINISNGTASNSQEVGFFDQNTGVFLNAATGSIIDVRVNNNIFKSNTLYGLRAGNTLPSVINNLTVIGNQARANGQYGIIIAQSGSLGLDGLMMTGNQSYQHSIKDIRLGPSPVPVIKYTLGNLFVTSEGF